MMIGVFLLVGLMTGIISGLLGIGGGVLLIPMLMFVLRDHDQHRAQAMTLAVLVLPVVLPAVYAYYSHNFFKEGDVFLVLLLAAGFAAGGYLGAHLVHYVPIAVLRMLLGLVLVYVAVRFLLASSNEFAVAFFGLIAVSLSLTAYYFLKALGRKHMARPALGPTIASMSTRGASELDYYI